MPVCFALWRILYLYAINADQMPFVDVLDPALSAGGVALGVTVAAWIAIGRVEAASVIGSAVVVALQSVGSVSGWLTTLGPVRRLLETYPSASGLPALAILATGAVALGVMLRRGVVPLVPVARFARAFGFAILGVSVAMAAWSGASRVRVAAADARAQPPGEMTLGSEEKPDIYLIVLDRYMGGEQLGELGFNNDGFLDFLRSRDFYVADEARSNYSITYTSLASMLNMRYLEDLTDVPERPRTPPAQAKADLAPFYELIERPQVVELLKREGYGYTLIRSGWGATDKSPLADRVLATSGDTEFSSMLKQDDALAGAADAASGELHRERILNTFECLRDSTRIPGPKMVLAHMLLPHPPYAFKADGSPVTADVVSITEENGPARAALYLDQVRYANTRLEEVLSHIIENNERPTVIIVTGDHGGAYRARIAPVAEREARRQKHSVLHAVRLPGGRESGDRCILPCRW